MERAEKKDVTWHINKEGLSNQMVAELMEEYLQRWRELGKERKMFFLGVHPWDSLPVGELFDRISAYPGKTITMIINIGGHFTSLIIEKNHAIYIDSFAGSLHTPDSVKKLFIRLKEKYGRVYRNRNQIQSFSSTHCGLYSVLYCAWYLMDKDKRIKIFFHRQALEKNDDLCVQYLKEIYSEQH